MAAAIDLSGAASLEEQVYLGILEMQKKELAIPADTRPDNVQVAFDQEAATVALSVSLTTVTTIENGKAVIAAQSYLV